MDLLLKNARLIEGDGEVERDVSIANGRIDAVAERIAHEPRDHDCEVLDLCGRLVLPGFVESHIHLDKACILGRCDSNEGTLAEAIREVSAAKRRFTPEDLRTRAVQVIERAITHGTTRMRAHLEVDPGIGLMGIEAVMPLVDEYRWAIDLQICVFPQEGMLNNPGTEALMVEALSRGAKVVGGCPYTDTDPLGQIARVFALAQDFDVDIDFHLDFDTNPQGMTLAAVCQHTEQSGWGGRVTVGHAAKLSAITPSALSNIASKMATSGVSLTVLPATDLFLLGGSGDRNVVRGVAPAHYLSSQGVACSLSTNNVLNPFTPFGDCSMVRIANLYANIARLGTRSAHRDCLNMVTHSPATMLRISDYGIAPGNPGDCVVLDCGSAEAAVQEIAMPLFAYKNGRRTFTRPRAQLHRP